jgi:hypothetical protein
LGDQATNEVCENLKILLIEVFELFEVFCLNVVSASEFLNVSIADFNSVGEYLDILLVNFFNRLAGITSEFLEVFLVDVEIACELFNTVFVNVKFASEFLDVLLINIKSLGSFNGSIFVYRLRWFLWFRRVLLIFDGKKYLEATYEQIDVIYLWLFKIRFGLCNQMQSLH